MSDEPLPDLTNIVVLGSRTLRYGGLDSLGVSLGPHTLPYVLSQDRSLVGNAGTSDVRYGNELDGVAMPLDSENLQAIFAALKQAENPVQWSEGPTLFGLNKSCGFNHIKTLCEIFFETESGTKLDIHSNQELALYAHAKGDDEIVKATQTGISLDVGDVTTTASAFVHGSLVSERVLRLGGRDVTNYLRELLNNGSLNQEPRSQEILYKLKEEHCYVATPNFEAASQRRPKDSSLAVDAAFGSFGQRVHFEVERFTCPEILFKPHMIGRDCGGNSRKDLLANLFLSGGSTLFKGFAERLQFELKFLHEGMPNIFSSSRVKVHELGINAAFEGAVAFAKVSREAPSYSRASLWMDNNDWYESGEVAVKKKFFRSTVNEHVTYSWSNLYNYYY